EGGVRPGGGRQHECAGHDEEDDERAADRRHVNVRPPVRATNDTAASTAANPETASATIASVELPPPPSDDFASTVGAGVSDDSGPAQSTTDPSEYVCRTLNV